MKRQIDVVGAVIVRHGEVLCAQRGSSGSLPGMWEFPGGKIEPGETAPEALRREIWEELRCDIRVGDHITTTSHEYEFGIVNLTTYYCELAVGEPEMTEHSNLQWRRPADLANLDWAPADVPAVEQITADLAA